MHKKAFQRLGPIGLKLCHLYDAIVIGSSAETLALNLDRGLTDIDIIVSPDKWVLACKLIPLTAVANEFGGFKFIDGEVETDVWAGDAAQTLLKSPTRDRVRYLWSPSHSGCLIFDPLQETVGPSRELVTTKSAYPMYEMDWSEPDGK